MPSITIKFSEFVDQLLVRLYELDREQPGEFQNLSVVADSLVEKVPAEWIFDAGKVLDSRGFADVLFTFGGTDAKISGEGRLYVEEGRGTTSEIQSHPQNYFLTIQGDNNHVISGSANSTTNQGNIQLRDRSATFELIAQAIRKLDDDQSLSGPARSEAKTFANLIKSELEKPQPNRNLVAALLDPLSKIASIAGSISTLVKFFNASH